MLTDETAMALQNALKEWSRAKAWANEYAHEDIDGAYSEKVVRARQKVVRAAMALAKDEAA